MFEQRKSKKLLKLKIELIIEKGNLYMSSLVAKLVNCTSVKKAKMN